jgi:hypothetical protein
MIRTEPQTVILSGAGRRIFFCFARVKQSACAVEASLFDPHAEKA